MAAEPLLLIGQVSLSGKTPELQLLDEWLKQMQLQCGWDSQLHFRMELALHEAVPNIYEHATHPGYAPVEVVLFQSVEGYVLQLTDMGVPFNPLHQPAYQRPETLESASPNGRGIHLIRQFTDKQAYRRVNDKNVLTLHFVC